MASQRTKDAAIVAAIVAVLFAVFVGLRLYLGGDTPRETGPDVPAASPGGARPRSRTPAGPRKGPSTHGDRAATVEEDPAPTDPVEAASVNGLAGADSDIWKERGPVEFTPEDTVGCGSGVTVDMGDYTVRKGEEFEVAVGFTSPALESCTLVIGYDPASLAVVPGTAEPRGTQFRGGIECYADEKGGKLILIQSGTPGKKNIDSSSGGVSAAWRMRALRAGPTTLKVLDSTSFANSRGSNEAFTANGGDVSVRE